MDTSAQHQAHQEHLDDLEGRAEHVMLKEEFDRQRESERGLDTAFAARRRAQADEDARVEMIKACMLDMGSEGVARVLHAHTAQRLRDLRGQRDALNDSIRELVEVERVLGLAVTRFDRLASGDTTTTEKDTTDAPTA